MLQTKKTLIYGRTSSKRPITGILRKQTVSKCREDTETVITVDLQLRAIIRFFFVSLNKSTRYSSDSLLSDK